MGLCLWDVCMCALAYVEDDIHCTICMILVIFISFHGALSPFFFFLFFSDSYCLMKASKLSVHVVVLGYMSLVS